MMMYTTRKVLAMVKRRQTAKVEQRLAMPAWLAPAGGGRLD